VSFLGRHKKKLLAIALLLGAGPAAHLGVSLFCRIDPPAVEVPAGTGRAATRVLGGIRVAVLDGAPAELGAQHARLLRERMIADEDEVWKSFEHFVPSRLARTLIFDLGRARYRNVDASIPEPRRIELAAQSRAFAPDPFEDKLPTFHRMVMLHALYDVALSFEQSPLLGCSSFGLGPRATRDGHTLFARAFDFEAGDAFDRDKVLYLVRPRGKIPFASVAWPGLVGVLSGMNAEGVAVVVHGGRAGEPRAAGVPVVFSMREVLENATTTREAVALLSKQEVMVSHIAFVADAAGRFAIVERAPEVPAFVRDRFPDPDRVALTNHFEGPLKDDPKDARVRATTTTLDRRARLDELLAALRPEETDAARAIAMLRDHACAKGLSCELGDRRSIDALIATHGVVADTTARVLWVSAGPHLSGRFVRYDVGRMLREDFDLASAPEPETAPEDPILLDGRFEEGRRRAGGPRVGGDKRSDRR
jgi:hypothetical protein